MFNFHLTLSRKKLIESCTATVFVIFGTFAHAIMRNLFCHFNVLDKEKLSLRFINRINCVFLYSFQHGRKKKTLKKQQNAVVIFVIYFGRKNHTYREKKRLDSFKIESARSVQR